MKNPYELRHIKLYIKQKIIPSSHQSDVFYIENSKISKRRSTTYEEYKTIVESDIHRLKYSINNKITDYFWSTISNNISLCVPNINDSFNLSETIKYGLPSLLEFQRRSPRLCSCSIRSSICIDLSTDEDNDHLAINEPDIQTNLDTVIDIDTQIDQDSDPSYSSSSSSTNNNTPTSINHNEQEDIWNIFDQISSQTKSNSTHFHPYSSDMYSSCPYFFHG